MAKSRGVVVEDESHVPSRRHAERSRTQMLEFHGHPHFGHFNFRAVGDLSIIPSLAINRRASVAAEPAASSRHVASRELAMPNHRARSRRGSWCVRNGAPQRSQYRPAGPIGKSHGAGSNCQRRDRRSLCAAMTASVAEPVDVFSARIARRPAAFSLAMLTRASGTTWRRKTESFPSTTCRSPPTARISTRMSRGVTRGPRDHRRRSGAPNSQD